MTAFSAVDPALSDPHPRNHWARLREVLALVQAGRLYDAEARLEGLRYHPELSDEIRALYARQIARARTEARRGPRLNLPSDYSAITDPRLLKPLRRLHVQQAPPRPYPWGMALPEFSGAGNDYRFLTDAASALAGPRHNGIRCLHVLWTPGPEGAAALPALLAALQGSGLQARVDLSLFGASGAGFPQPAAGLSGADLAATAQSGGILSGGTLPGGGEIRLHPTGLRSPEGLAEIARLSEESDLLIFLSGRPDPGPGFLPRLLHLAQISDRVVQPLCSQSGGAEFSSLLHDAGLKRRFSSRYPFREIEGFNLAIPARLMREVGLPDPRFEGDHLAAQEFGYRCHVQGAWFAPLPVRDLGYAPQSSPADRARYVGLCPNSWDRRTDARHEVAKVAVYIPAYNASKYLARAVDSVLGQDVQDLEVCIANDGSRDGTLALLERLYRDEPRVRWRDNRNGGIGYASNSAIAMSRSLYIGQLDSDDCLKPGAVRRLMTHLDENPGIACVYGSCERIDAAGNFLQNEYSWPVFSREKMMITSIAHHFRMFRRQAFARTPGFREDIVNGVDYDIFLKMSEVGDFHHIDERLYQRRWHGENTSHVNEHHQTANTYRVQRETLKRLGLRHWDVHVADPAKPRVVSYKLNPETKMVVSWPDYSRSNPYQKLLYGQVREKAELVSGDIGVALKLLDSQTVAPEDLTFHLHWLNAIFPANGSPELAEAAVENFLAQLESFLARGGRLVWTIHNTLSHDQTFQDLERRLSIRLTELAHVLHFHAAASVAEVAAEFPIPREKVRIARHGHYIGSSPDFLDRDEARAMLGIAPDEDVLLFTGQIRPYKGIETLLAAAERLLAQRPRLRLILAGKPGFDPLAGLDPALAARVIQTGRFVEPEEWQLVFRAADLAVYPYRRILTSGSLLLALSHGVPVVVPRVGMTAEVLEGREAGALYEAEGGDGAEGGALTAALRRMLAQKDSGGLARMAQNARLLAQSQSWEDLTPILFGEG